MLTNLPCNITPSSDLDRVNIVLWYKDGLGKPLYRWVPISGGTGIQNPGFGHPRSTMEQITMGWRQVEQGFYSFICHIWWFFKVEHAESALQNFEKSSNMAKNEEKPSSTCLQLFSGRFRVPENRSSDFFFKDLHTCSH